MSKDFEFVGFTIAFWKSRGIVKCNMSTYEDVDCVDGIPKGTHINIKFQDYWGTKLGKWYKDCFPTRELVLEAVNKERHKEIIKHKKAIDKLNEMTF